jgi:tetratricopeptide (TPR) repeat protein
LKDEAAKPLLLVLDDFEANLEPRDDGYVLQPEAVIVLEALVCAIKNTYAPHRLILTCRYDFESNLLQDFYKQPLEGLRGADLRKKCSRLCAFDAKSQVDEALQSQARRLADGNPRLLEWLNKVLLDSTVDREAIFQRLEADPVELREQVLAAELLQQMDSPIREMLSRGLVFELPVPREALAVICESIPNLEQHIDRAVALGLLEVSPDKSLRVPRILPLRLGEDENLTEGFDVTSLYQQAAEVLYCLWWEGGKLAEDEQKTLEIHRLALRGKVEKIAVEIAFHLANYWTNRSRFREAVQLCQSTLEISKDYRIWHELGRSEESLGGVANAKQDYQKALDICPSDDEKEKAAILHNLASLQAKQGQIEEAITLYEQSLAIEEAIGNILGKAVTLHELGSLKAKQGQIEEAITLFQQSLVINKTIDNVQVKAATLNQLGSLKFNQGQIEEAITLLKQSLAIEETIGNVRGKAATLRLLGWIYSHQGKVNEAFALFQQSLEIEESIENAEGKAEALYAIAEIYTQQGQIEEAIPRFEQSLAINETIGNAQGTAATLLWLGVLVANVQGDFDTALEYLQQSLKILELIQSPDAEVVRQLIDRVQQMAQN